ncbi:hypothetical protein KR222_010974, partial [Zaprionus bogoriensis]
SPEIAVSCVICSERYKQSDSIHAGSCGHVFHSICLQRWNRESSQCPICRSRDSQYFQIYLDFDEFAPSVSNRSSHRQREREREQQAEANNNANSSEYENLLYEAALYRDEIDYLNNRIKHLTDL